MAGTFFSSIRTSIAALNQKPDEVYKRDPGERTLNGPYPAKPEAHADWHFALISVAAYGRSNPKRQSVPLSAGAVSSVQHMWKERNTDNSQPQTLPLSPPQTQTPDVDAQLKAIGWTRWTDFPDAPLEKRMVDFHLRAEVWEHKEQRKIVVAFGGTVFTSGEDWVSNLRWFLPTKVDEYSAIVQTFAPDFVKAFTRMMQTPDTAYLKEVTIYSTGHSLGGGLAQQFAYAMPEIPGGPKVAEVYAFDPSPVTGFYSVDVATREANCKGLKIARIYERGEVLAVLRSFTSLIYKPSARDPEVRGARFNLFYSLNAIADHSMANLANKMRTAAGE